MAINFTSAPLQIDVVLAAILIVGVTKGETETVMPGETTTDWPPQAVVLVISQDTISPFFNVLSR